MFVCSPHSYKRKPSACLSSEKRKRVTNDKIHFTATVSCGFICHQMLHWWHFWLFLYKFHGQVANMLPQTVISHDIDTFYVAQTKRHLQFVRRWTCGCLRQPDTNQISLSVEVKYRLGRQTFIAVWAMFSKCCHVTRIFQLWINFWLICVKCLGRLYVSI